MPHHEENKAKRKKEVSHSSIFTNISGLLLLAAEKKLRNWEKLHFSLNIPKLM